MGATGIKLFARMPDDSIVMRDHTGDYEQVAARMLAFYDTAEKICEYLLHDKLADGDEESRSDFGGAFCGPAHVVTRTQLPPMDSNDEDAVQMGFHNRWFWRDVNDRIGWTPFVTTTFMNRDDEWPVWQVRSSVLVPVKAPPGRKIWPSVWRETTILRICERKSVPGRESRLLLEVPSILHTTIEHHSADDCWS